MKPKTWIQGVNLAIEGFIYAVKTERHMRYHMIAAAFILVLSLILNVSRLEFIILCFAIVMVIIAELINTAIEVTIDMISEDYHPLAKIAKDIGAAVVLVASIGALTIAYLILYPAVRTTLGMGIWNVKKAPMDVIAFVSLAVVVIIVVIIKAVLGKGEPLRGGMPSGHAAVSFSIWVAAIFLSHSLPLAILIFLLASMVSWSRWSSGVHSPLEVIAGALIGAGVTSLFFLIFGR